MVTTSTAARAVARAAAAAVAIAAVASIAAFIAFVASGDPYGTLNDIANAALGLLTAVLALGLLGAARSTAGWIGLAAVVIGAVLMVIGSVLVVSAATGWYLAALVSSVGIGFMGIWLLLANRVPPVARVAPRWLRRFGIVAGAMMTAGLLGLPGVVAGADDLDSTPWYLVLVGASWAGMYLAFPTWCAVIAIGRRPLHG